MDADFRGREAASSVVEKYPVLTLSPPCEHASMKTFDIARDAPCKWTFEEVPSNSTCRQAGRNTNVRTIQKCYLVLHRTRGYVPLEGDGKDGI